MRWRERFNRAFARLTTDVVTRRPWLWRVFRRPLRRIFERLAPHWDRLPRPDAVVPLEAALVAIEPPGRALDLGTGTGLAALALARRFPAAEVVGVDLAPAMVGEARAKLTPELAARVRFECHDAARLPYADAAFELVTLANMIPFWDELARVVAPGGTVVLSFGSGAGTPIYVSPERVRAELGRRGFTEFADFSAGRGTAVLARRKPER